MSCAREKTLTTSIMYLSPLKRKDCAAKLDFWSFFFFHNPSFKIAISERAVSFTFWRRPSIRFWLTF